MVIHRKQFPLPQLWNNYNKNQGITCKNAMMDLGTSVFSDGQAYVGLSRVSILEGLHLINFPLKQIWNIVEYNRLSSICVQSAAITNPFVREKGFENSRLSMNHT